MSALPHPSYTYRRMTVADLAAAHDLSVQLKWPHRLDDWAMLHRVSDGFVVMDGSRLIGSAFVCPQGDFATIGLVTLGWLIAATIGVWINAGVPQAGRRIASIGRASCRERV